MLSTNLKTEIESLGDHSIDYVKVASSFQSIWRLIIGLIR